MEMPEFDGILGNVVLQSCSSKQYSVRYSVQTSIHGVPQSTVQAAECRMNDDENQKLIHFTGLKVP